METYTFNTCRCETWEERACPQVLQGSDGVEVGVGASGLGGLAGGFGFFQPLHLHEASALQLEYIANFSNFLSAGHSRTACFLCWILCRLLCLCLFPSSRLSPGEPALAILAYSEILWTEIGNMREWLTALRNVVCRLIHNTKKCQNTAKIGITQNNTALRYVWSLVYLGTGARICNCFAWVASEAHC